MMSLVSSREFFVGDKRSAGCRLQIWAEAIPADRLTHNDECDLAFAEFAGDIFVSSYNLVVREQID